MNTDFYKEIPEFGKMTDEELVECVKKAVEEFEKNRPMMPELSAWFQEYGESAYLLIGKVSQRLAAVVSGIDPDEFIFFGERTYYGNSINSDGTVHTHTFVKSVPIKVNRKPG